MTRHTESSSRSRGYQNAVLTVIAALLGVLALHGAQSEPLISSASASQGSGRAIRGGGGMANPAQQRQETLTQLREINASLKKLVSKVDGKVVDVNVVSMPARAAAPE